MEKFENLSRMINKSDTDLFTVSEVASLINVSNPTIRSWIDKGDIKPFKVDRKKEYFHKSQIPKFLLLKTNIGRDKNYLILVGVNEDTEEALTHIKETIIENLKAKGTKNTIYIDNIMDYVAGLYEKIEVDYEDVSNAVNADDIKYSVMHIIFSMISRNVIDVTRRYITEKYKYGSCYNDFSYNQLLGYLFGNLPDDEAVDVEKLFEDNVPDVKKDFFRSTYDKKIRDILKKHGMTQVVRDAGISTEKLYYFMRDVNTPEEIKAFFDDNEINIDEKSKLYQSTLTEVAKNKGINELLKHLETLRDKGVFTVEVFNKDNADLERIFEILQERNYRTVIVNDYESMPEALMNRLSMLASINYIELDSF